MINLKDLKLKVAIVDVDGDSIAEYGAGLLNSYGEPALIQMGKLITTNHGLVKVDVTVVPAARYIRDGEKI